MGRVPTGLRPTLGTSSLAGGPLIWNLVLNKELAKFLLTNPLYKLLFHFSQFKIIISLQNKI